MVKNKSISLRWDFQVNSSKIFLLKRPPTWPPVMWLQNKNRPLSEFRNPYFQNPTNKTFNVKMSTYIHTLLRLPSTRLFSHNVNYYIILVIKKRKENLFTIDKTSIKEFHYGVSFE